MSRRTIALPSGVDLNDVEWDELPRRRNNTQHRLEARHRRKMAAGWAKIRAVEKAKLQAMLDKLGKKFAKEQRSIARLEVMLAARKIYLTYSVQRLREAMWLAKDEEENEKLAERMVERDIEKLKEKRP